MPIPITVVAPPTSMQESVEREPDPYTYGAVLGQLTAASGDVLHLTDCTAGLDWLPGASGLDMPPFTIAEDVYTAGDGSVVRPGGVRAEPRQIVLPTLLHLDRYGDWRKLQQRYARALNPLAGPARLDILQPDGTSRYVTVTYTGGAEGQEVQGPPGLWLRQYATALRAHDPWAYGPDAEPLIWRGVSGAGDFLGDPFLPLRVGASQVIGDVIVDNVGDVPAFPVWTITGPGRASFTNTTTGRSFALDRVLLAGEVATVDTRPLRVSVRLADGTSLWPDLGPAPQLWTLLPGRNSISLTVIGSTVATQVRLNHTPRYLTL